MAKKTSLTATVDYVNFTVNQAVNPLEDRVSKLEENHPSTGIPDSETHSSEGIYDSLSPEEQFEMVLNHYRDQAIGQLCVEEVRKIMKDYLPSIRFELLHFLDDERKQLANFRTDDNHDFCVKHNAMLERLKDLEARDKAFDSHIEKLAEERKAFRKEYRRALDVDSLAQTHTGLFLRGHHILPSWLLTLVFVIIFIMAICSSYLILDQQEQIGHQKSQIEHLQRGAKNEHLFRKG